MEKIYIGHTNPEKHTEQRLKDHLMGTGEKAAAFGEAFGEAALVKQIGEYHDIGKYSDNFQEYIEIGSGKKVDHSTAGAQEFFKKHMPEAAFCVGGHHCGLPNYGTSLDTETGSTLYSKIIRKDLPDYQAYLTENEPIQTLKKSLLQKSIYETGAGFSFMFYVRMLFSCLVDADFLDTEAFMSDEKVIRDDFDTIEILKKRLDCHITRNLSNPDSSINKKRCEILQQCIAAGDNLNINIQNLTVPTGGGKTISSLAFALHAAVKNKRQRVIYVIPYTSIIEQTANVFSGILGEKNIVEHHINVEYDDLAEKTDYDTECKRLATENWDAPIIVTTNVQFFESLFANKSSKCRKLHSIANSIVIFDEAQMLPIEYLIPCTKAIEELAFYYNCTAVLCTATQPSLTSFFEKIKPQEICHSVEQNYEFFKRTNIKYMNDIVDNEEIAEKILSNDQALCIVNTKKQAQEIFDILKKNNNDGIYYLSTNLYPVHRTQVLKEIKQRLSGKKPCKVVATSLVEAGVDLDFPVVYRELTGLDSILQAAGRCNREGKNKAEESFVYIFKTVNTKRNRQMALAIEITEKILFDISDTNQDISSPEVIKYYFELLHKVKGSSFLDNKNIIETSERATIPFDKVAKDFVLIETMQKPVYIPTTENEKITERLKNGERNRKLLRQAGKYMVNVYFSDKDIHSPYEKLHAAQKIEIDEGLAILVDESLYDKQKGLICNIEDGQGIFISK